MHTKKKTNIPCPTFISQEAMEINSKWIEVRKWNDRQDAVSADPAKLGFHAILKLAFLLIKASIKNLLWPLKCALNTSMPRSTAGRRGVWLMSNDLELERKRKSGCCVAVAANVGDNGSGKKYEKRGNGKYKKLTNKFL